MAQHLTLRLDGDRPLARSVAARRAAARTLLHVGRDFDLLAFGIADTHVHILSGTEPCAAAELARRIKIALHRALQLGAPFLPTRIRAVEDTWHLYRAIPYVVGQPERHAPGLDPCFEGSSLPDLLGLRVADEGRLARAVFELAPRLDRAAVIALLGVDPFIAAELDWSLLADAAAAAFAHAELVGRSSSIVRARVAAVHTAAALSTGEIASLLGVGTTCVNDARRASSAQSEIEAVRAQLGLRSVLQRGRGQDHRGPGEVAAPPLARRDGPAPAPGRLSRESPR